METELTKFRNGCDLLEYDARWRESGSPLIEYDAPASASMRRALERIEKREDVASKGER